MALLTALAALISLANGHRIQPSAALTRKFQNSLPASDNTLSLQDSPNSVQSETKPVPESPKAGHSADAQKQTAFENFSHFTSMIQEQVSSTKLKTAFDTAKNKISSHPFLGEVPLSVMGYVVASGFVAFFWCFWCLAQRLVSYLPRKGSRIQYIHDGRVVYEWDQTPKAVTIYIRPPKGLAKSELDIKIANRNIKVGRKDKPSFLAEETYDLVNEQMSSWSLRSHGELQIILRKARRGLWPIVLMHKDTGARKFSKAPKKPKVQEK